MKVRVSLKALLLICLILGPADLWAQEKGQEISVTAGSMKYLPDGTLEAEGNVMVEGEGMNVRADRLRYDPGSDTLILTGNVVMKEDGGGSFTGDALALNLADLTGGISRGEIIIVQNGFRVLGEDINRIGPEEYSIRKGVFTSCPGECPDWSFTASRIEVQKEGYLEARHAAFRIVGIPVFYTPYLFYPVKTKRQTGLLFPEFGFSDESGLESMWPVFITLGSHADATVSPRTFSRDSSGLGLESRYRLDWGGGGQITGFAMSGESSDNWYVRAEHSNSLTPDLWLRGRWYDTGDPDTTGLYGDSFEDRYPGVVYRHASLEGAFGILGFNVQTSSLLADGTLASSDIPGTALNRDLGMVRFGPGGGDLWRMGIEVEDTHFEGDGKRTLVSPTLVLQIPGPWKLAGHIQGRGIIGTGGEGSTEDETYIVSLAEKLAVESSGAWGKHLVDLEITASAAQGAAFGESAIRDGRDMVEERKVIDARVRSILSSSRFRWDLTAGSWRDHELDLSQYYAITRLSYSSVFLAVSRNRDDVFRLVLPSIFVGRDTLKSWQVEAGYESNVVGVAVGRDSSEGSPEMLSGSGHLDFPWFRIAGETSYDMDTDTLADETITVLIPGRCWTMSVERSRSPDRTGWKMQFELGI